MIRRNAEMLVDEKFELMEGKGTVYMKHIYKADELKAGTRICCEVTVPPHCSVGAHAHKGEEEVYYIAKGTAVVDDNGEGEYTLYEGDAMHTGNGAYHSIANNTDEDLVFIALVVVYC